MSITTEDRLHGQYPSKTENSTRATHVCAHSTAGGRGWGNPAEEQRGSAQFRGSEQVASCPQLQTQRDSPGDKEGRAEDLAGAIYGGGELAAIWVAMIRGVAK